jgi:hypothetical protein
MSSIFSNIQTTNTILGIIASSGAASVAFDPLSIANCKLWLDASDTSTISLSGSEVTQWNDKSGNSKNVTQSTSARRPSSGLNTINSKNVITFGGDDLLQASTASDWAFLHNSGGSTVFAVSISDNTAAAEFPIFATSTGSGQVGCAFRIAYDPPLDKFSPFVSTGGGSGTLVSLISAGGVTVGTAFYASGIWDNNNATLANRSLWRQNGEHKKEQTHKMMRQFQVIQQTLYLLVLTIRQEPLVTQEK